MTKLDFTVAICTYNGEQRLPDVLERLRSQRVPESLQWEILVIDNNSTDNTAKVVQEYQANWPETFPLHYKFEFCQGAAHARRHAMRVAQSELVGFLDDDNLPEPDWVATAVAFGQANPTVGAYGSQIHGLFEVEPPPELERLLPFLAIVERGEEPLKYRPCKKLLPPAAGLVVRRQAYLEHVPENCLLTGRTATSMLTGEDTEMLCYIWLGSWEIWYNPAMKVYHKISSNRLQRSYLIPFFKGIGLSRYVTRMLSVKPWQRPFLFWGHLFNDLRKLIVHLLKYRTQVNHDLATACELQLFFCSLISPVYIWRHIYLNRWSQKLQLSRKSLYPS